MTGTTLDVWNVFIVVTKYLGSEFQKSPNLDQE